MHRATITILISFWIPTLAPVGSLPAQEPTPVTAEARDAAILRAVRYLDDNMWRSTIGGSPYKQYTVAVAAWAYTLAAAGGGKKLKGRKKHIDRMRKYLIRYTETVGREYDRDAKKPKRDPGRLAAFMRPAQYNWPLSMVAHLFAERAARGKSKGEAKKVLKTIVTVLEAAQQPNGGWGHDDASRPGMGLPKIKIPKPGGGNFDYPATLLAASNCALSALGVAYRQLRKKPGKALSAGRDYFAKAQNADGTFPYDPKQKHGGQPGGAMMGGIEIARTAGALFAVCCAGAPNDDPVVTKAAAAIDKNPELMSEGHGSATMALQFGALASRARGERTWQTFRRIFFPRILAHQDEDGSFTCCAVGKSAGVTVDTKPLPGIDLPGLTDNARLYVTAIHVLILVLDRVEPKALPKIPGAKGPITGAGSTPKKR